MSIVLGVGLSNSPFLYRPRQEWPAISASLIGNVTQPKSRDREDEEMLADYARRIQVSLETADQVVKSAELDALIVLYADRGDMFDQSNLPQLHVQIGGEAWGDSAIRSLGEDSRRTTFRCAEGLGELLSEELARDGFDVSEGRGALKPIGGSGRGMGPAVSASVERLGNGLPVIPVHVNCHFEPMPSGDRLHAFGVALARAAASTQKRLGILVTGGLSGDPGGPMAGWIDDVLDDWVLSRITAGESADLADVWRVRSRTLRGNSAEIRLWSVAAAALESAGCRARVVDYLPVHHAATGVAFVTWEQASCPSS